MPQSIRSGSSFDSLIPALTDNADIVKALKDYHYGTISHPTTQGQENDLTTGIVGLFNSKIGSSSPTFTGTVSVDGQNSQFPVSLSLEEAVHATSRRTSIQLGLGWQIGQDSVGNGTKNFYIFQTSTGIAPFTISATSNIAIGGTGYTTTFTGTVALPSTTSIGNVSSTELGYLDGVTSAIQTQISNKSNSLDPTFTGTVTLPSGTTSAAPLKFNTGTTKLDTILVGTVEYDGNIFYATPKVNNTTAGRGLVETPYVYVAAADAQVVISTAQSDGSNSGTTTDTDTASAFGRYIYLAANSTYMIETNVMVSHSFTDVSPSTANGSGNITFGFQYPSGTTFSLDVSQIINQTSALTSPPASAPIPYIYTQSTSDVSLKSATATATATYSMFRIRGIVRTSSTAGNFAPKLITTSTTTNDGDAQNSFVSRGNILKDSFIKVTPLGGTTSSVNIGGWA